MHLHVICYNDFINLQMSFTIELIRTIFIRTKLLSVRIDFVTTDILIIHLHLLQSPLTWYIFVYDTHGETRKGSYRRFVDYFFYVKLLKKI